MMTIDTEKIADWLLTGLELKSTLFHVGQYCGNWQASTAGHQRASFHVVLHGECWLHMPATPRRPARHEHLAQGDVVFLLHDAPHCLSPLAAPPSVGQESERFGIMQPLSTDADADADAAGAADSLGLACGFFEFRSGLNAQILGFIPDYVIARRDDGLPDGLRAVFDLIRAEAHRPTAVPSALIGRLTELLFFYALRAVVTRDDIAPSLWSLMCRSAFAPLITAIIDAPAEQWTTDKMASFVHMSRARFCKLFLDVCGQPPAQFVTLIRMKVAATLLRSGTPTLDAAERVGYQSESAFAHAFKRVTGEQPGAYRRNRAGKVVNDAGALRTPAASWH